MTGYNQECIESIRTRTRNYSDAGFPLDIQIGGRGVSYSFSDVLTNLKLVDELNQVPTFECELVGLSGKSTIQYNDSVHFRVGSKFIFGKQVVREKKAASNFYGGCSGVDSALSVLKDVNAAVTNSASDSSSAKKPT